MVPLILANCLVLSAQNLQAANSGFKVARLGDGDWGCNSLKSCQFVGFPRGKELRLTPYSA